MTYEEALARFGLNPDIRLRQMFELGKLASQQEPVAYAVYHRMGGSKSLHWPEQHSDAGDHNQYQLVPLYPSPPEQRKPMSDDERGHLVIEHLGTNAILHKPMSIYDAFHMGIDAAEAAHGIKENT